jgi:hypothetical protein
MIRFQTQKGKLIQIKRTTMATKNNVSHHNKIMFHIAIKHSKTDSIKTQTY